MWWAAVIALAVVAVALRWLHALRELQRATGLLYQGDPEGFERIVVAERRWQGRCGSQLNRAVAAFWVGRFDESLALLHETRARRMNTATRAAYDTCELAALIMLGRAREAESLYAEREPSMRRSGHPLTKLMCDGVEADLALFARGDLVRARRLNEELLAMGALPAIAVASIHWSLAEIAARLGEREHARRHLVHALDPANKTFVAERAATLRARLEGEEQREASRSDDAERPRDSLTPVVRG